MSIHSVTSSDRGLLALDANYLEANRIFVTSADSGEYRELKGLAVVSCGLPVEQLNFGFLLPPFDGIEANAQSARAYFEEQSLPFRLAFRDGSSDAPQRLADWNETAPPVPGMTIATDVRIPEPPASLVIEPVRTSEQLVAYRQTAFAGFGFPVQAAHLFLTDRFLQLPHVHLYAGSIEGRVVATSMLVATAGVAGIYWVATIDEYRGQGLGTALTWAAVRGGRELGCPIASLQASDMGRPVYARMGFDHVLSYRHLTPS